ncbi:MAG: BPL-N domain-containing protein [Nitrospiraceae bacterium]|nr:BPL-N domain-containing protein [Nitrospiraceae bacterium]
MRRAALLWDESFLWGVMAHKAIDACGLSCDLLRAEDVRNGRLREYDLLFVPGGWASNKLKALGSDGIEAVKRFVHDGGSYLGFCGGAGLATEDGLGLVPVKRRPTKERVPSFSGRIRINTSDHPLWQGIAEPVFHAWWPSQFLVDESVSVLATYGEAMTDSFSSDINVGDAETGDGWMELERIYQINLDPRRLMGEPAIIEGAFGKGTVLLSLVHFDTPCDPNGKVMLRNIWNYFGCEYIASDSVASAHRDALVLNVAPDPLLSELEDAANGLIELGMRNFLWFWKNPLLLQWRRGVRGLEYCTLYVMLKEISELLRAIKKNQKAPDLDRTMERIRALLLPFVEKARRLLVRERFFMQNGHITYERCDDREVQGLREELFSRSKSYGGLFKELVDEIDGLLYKVMTLSS